MKTEKLIPLKTDKPHRFAYLAAHGIIGGFTGVIIGLTLRGWLL